MQPKTDIKRDCIGRPIPNWDSINLFIPTDFESIHFNIQSFLMSKKFCLALTDISQAKKGVSLISCTLKNGSKILNLNDFNDYKLAKECMGEFDISNIDDEMLKYISYCGFAGVFYPTIVGVKICDPAKHLVHKGITRKH